MSKKAKKVEKVENEQKVVELEFDLEGQDLLDFKKVSEKMLFDLTDVQAIYKNATAQREGIITTLNFYNKILSMEDVEEFKPYVAQLKDTVAKLEQQLETNTLAIEFAKTQVDKYQDFYNEYFDNYQIENGKVKVKPEALVYARQQAKLIADNWKDYIGK